MRGAAALLLAVTTAAPSVEFTVPVEHRLVEGIASDGRTVWVSSIIDRTIIVVRGKSRRTIRLPDGTANPFGLAWDAQRQWLWIATDCPRVAGIVPCDSGALVAIDASGKLKAGLKSDAPFHPGDVSFGGGAVFVSDSQNGAVYRLGPAGRKLDTVVAPEVGKSAQGSALSADGKMLVVADYAQGITRIDLATGSRMLVLFDGKPLRGVDGLGRDGEWYIGIQNGGSVGRLLAFRIIDGALDVRVLGKGGALVDPTQLVVASDAVLVVADSGWATIDKQGARATPATIVRFARPWSS